MAEEGYRMGNLPDEYDPRDRPLLPASEVQTLSSGETSASEAPPSKPFILPDLPPGKPYGEFEPSRLFAYYYGRIKRPVEQLGQTEDDGYIQQGIKKDTGANNRRIIHTFLMQGVCKEELWPYGTPSSDKPTHLFNTSNPPNPCEPKDWSKVSWQAKSSSHPHDGKALAGEQDVIPRAISFYRIYDPNVAPKPDAQTNVPVSNWQIIYNNPPVALLEKVLTKGFPFIFGCRLYTGASLANSQIDENGIFVKPPTTNEAKDLGGHALMAVGFDSAKRLFLVQNSWGTGWPAQCKDEKMKGRFWMPYEWFEAIIGGSPITYDFWVIRYEPTM